LPDGYMYERSEGMLMLVDGTKILGKLEYAPGVGTCFIHWLVAPGHGTKLLKAFEQTMLKKGYREIKLNFKADSGSEALTQKRVNFYAKHGYKLIYSEFRSDGYHMLWWKGFGLSIDYVVADREARKMRVFK
jgi:hypothetical protein